MMYISENNTLKLRLCDGATVHIKDEYIIKIIDSNSKVLKNLKERFLRRNICCTML